MLNQTPICNMYAGKMRMDIDIDMDMDMDSRGSDIAQSYSSGGGQPPSFGEVRRIVDSQPSDSTLQVYSDGQPPSVNDVGRRESSHSEPSCPRSDYEGPDAHEVQQPLISEIGAEKNHIINSELWQACAGPLVNLPAAGTPVVYFPQGHCEQVAASMKKDVNVQLPIYPSLPPNMFCILHNITLHADIETDEVYAQMTLQPVHPFDKEGLLRSDLLMKAHKPQTEVFCKTLTATDTSTHGGLSLPHSAAKRIFPPLDFSMQPPAQELVARDIHDNVWTFRHVYGGQPKRHLLTTGWSLFVSGKRLSVGDSVLFIRDEKQQLLLGIRRANRQPANPLSSVLSSDSMHIGILADAALAAARNSPFTIFYNPRASPSEFVIPLAKYYKSLNSIYSNQISIGIRFRMMFETEESGTRSYMGTIIGIGDLDDVRWKDSLWRRLKVEWDESNAGERGSHVSIWEIKPVITPLFINMQPSNQIQPTSLNPWARSAFQKYKRPDVLHRFHKQQQSLLASFQQNYAGGPDLSLHLGLLAP